MLGLQERGVAAHDALYCVSFSGTHLIPGKDTHTHSVSLTFSSATSRCGALISGNQGCRCISMRTDNCYFLNNVFSNETPGSPSIRGHDGDAPLNIEGVLFFQLFKVTVSCR